MKLLQSLFFSAALLSLAACKTTEIANVTANVKDDKQVYTSVQLWGVRKELKEDFEGTLKKLAEMGFDGVEFAKYFGPYKDDPQGLKDFLNSIGLKASGAHLGFQPLRKNFFKTVAFYKTLGVETIIVPMDKRSFDPARFDEFTAELNKYSKKLAKFGLKTGYHNHWQEFQDYKQDTFWNHTFANTNSNVVMQLDTGWVVYSGKDNIEIIKKFPGRAFTVHLKPKFAKEYEDQAEENGHYAFIGQDNFDWAPVLEAMIETGGTKWFVLEQEEYPLGLTQLESVAETKKGFDKIMAGLSN